MIKKFFVSCLLLVTIFSCGDDEKDPSNSDVKLSEYKSSIVGNWIPTQEACDKVQENYNKGVIFGSVAGSRFNFSSSDCSQTKYCSDAESTGRDAWEIKKEGSNYTITINTIGTFVISKLTATEIVFLKLENDVVRSSGFDLVLIKE